MTTAQRERFRQIAENPKSWPALQSHARLCLTIDERRSRSKSRELTLAILWGLLLLALAAGAEVVS